jgi:hypothetical protein
MQAHSNDSSAAATIDRFRVRSMWSMVCRFILYRLNNGRDAKILIVARSGATGTGKTTLAVHLAKWVQSLLQCPKCRYKNEHGEFVGGLFPPSCDQCPWCGFDRALATDTDWDGDDQSFIDIMEYCWHYARQSSPGDALLLDEAEQGADKRRSMSGSNVTLSKYWDGLRYKNNVTFVTMPSMLSVDKRLEEKGDILINVQRRGTALVQWLWLNDTTKSIEKIYVRNEYGHAEEIDFAPLHNDAAYNAVSRKKNTFFGEDGGTRDFYDEDDLDSARDDAKDTVREQVCQELSEKTELTQGEIGEVVDRSQQWVSKAVRGKL